LKPLTVKQLNNRIGKAVYVEDLEIYTNPKEALPASVFAWRYKDPFAKNKTLNDRIEELTVVQPSGDPVYTTYWNIFDYGVKWVAYDKPMK
jgi:hypothetical protein